MFLRSHLTALFFCLIFGHAVGQSTRVYNSVRIVGEAPEIDGLLSEPVWGTVEWSGDFIQQEPYENQPPSQQTAVKVLYDDNNLYIAVRAYDTEPEKIERRLARRDNFEGDWVAVAIDSYNDKLTAFSFSATAAGVKGDGMATNDDDWDETWDPVYWVNVSIDELGWLAEFRIPYNQLRFADVEEHVWGFQVMRQIFRKEEMSLWQNIPRESGRWVSLFGELRGIKNINPKKEIEIVPYVMGSLETSEKEEGNPFETGTSWGFNAGVNGKVAVSNDLTLNYTINPDFGQVEADPSEVNLSAYESFFEEKRPFFIEGANIYEFPLSDAGGGPSGRDNLFYSRRIGRSPRYEPDLADNEFSKVASFSRILGALKLSGKTRNGWSIGIMESVTNSEKVEIDNNGERRTEAAEPLTNYFNTRLQKDLNKGNTVIGGMVTATNRFINDSTLEFLPNAAYTGGFDFTNFWKERAYYFKTRIAFSYVSGTTEAITELQESARRYFQRPDASHLRVDTTLTSLFGNGGSVEGGKGGGGNWRYGFRVNWRSPQFELNDMGYLRTSDNIHQSAWVEYIEFEPVGIFRSFEVGISQWSGWDYSGTKKWAGIRLRGEAQFQNYFGANLGINRQGVELEISELRGGPAIRIPGSWGMWGFFRTDQRKKLVGRIWGSFNLGDLNHRTSRNIGIGLSYRPFNALVLSVSPNYNQAHEYARYVETVELKTENKYIMATLNRHTTNINIRIDFSITPDLSIQYWGQPFLFAGDYSNFMRVTDPANSSYYDQFHKFTESEISYDSDNNTYLIDENGDGSTDYSFENPDFSVYDFRSNLVVRWEYIPGSTVFLVWSQGKYGDESLGEFDINRQVQSLLDAKTSNVFLIKFSYRFSF